MRRVCVCLGWCLLLVGSGVAQTVPPAAPPTAPEAQPWRSDAKFNAALDEAHQLAKQRRYAFAIDALKKASKVAGQKDVAVLQEQFDLQMKMAGYKDAAATAALLSEVAKTPHERSRADAQRAQALYLQAGDKNKGNMLEASDAALKSALEQDPKNATAHYLEGKVLARLGQMDGARVQFGECLSCISPKDPMYLRAQHFSENPALALAKMAPAFTVTALDGSRFSLDAMGGRVVLIDFWATWCGPCNAELPHLQKIAQEFAGQPLVILSISWDDDEAKWKDFLARHNMTWMQYRDADHALSNMFGINAIPHYFTIDADGVLTAEILGGGSDVEGKLRKLVARAKAAPAPVTAVAGVGAGN